MSKPPAKGASLVSKCLRVSIMGKERRTGRSPRFPENGSSVAPAETRFAGGSDESGPEEGSRGKKLGRGGGGQVASNEQL